MKREKKKKLNKKDRFKEVKKAPVPMHSVPLFIKNIYGIETITDSGIFQVGENIFSKLYRISISDPSVKAHDVFQVFRGYQIMPILERFMEYLRWMDFLFMKISLI